MGVREAERAALRKSGRGMQVALNLSRRCLRGSGVSGGGNGRTHTVSMKGLIASGRMMLADVLLEGRRGGQVMEFETSEMGRMRNWHRGRWNRE